ncbi:MAG: hydantoinase/oxoprolinase family protein, partial [Rhodospirillales bacterium]|nr:hydantoinase/oxoprolinase family protein [Rhodospirillales bacterium]
AMDLVEADHKALAEFVHGTTISINTVLERKGAVTALLTTKGFRDVYAIGRGNRPQAFNLNFRRPQPLIGRDLSFEVDERMDARGNVLTPLDDAGLEEVARELDQLGVEAVAVCFLHAYANPGHERRTGEVLRAACPNLFVTLSHEILREYREYERTSTTALNAYVGPRVRAYLDRLEGYLEGTGFGGGAQIMKSNGGTMSLTQARNEPVSMMESGPVAGMIGAAQLARIMGIGKCIGFDMGGTTAKSSLITDAELEIRDGYFIGGYASGQPMQLPVADIVEVGAGGGSIAWCDDLGAMHVGPKSAGADPGPACYGLGGTDPVVTDADLYLGRLNSGRFLSGAMGLDTSLAEAAINERIAGPLGLGATEAALGIAKIADAAMSLAVRSVSVERGCDPRECTLLAFGGAGPVHALSLAREIFIPQVVVPKTPGNFSALGMLLASWRQDLVRTLVGGLDDLDKGAAETAFAELNQAGWDLLEAEHMLDSGAVFSFAADLRYMGQEHTIAVPVTDAGDFSPEGATGLSRDFAGLHEKRYGHASSTEPIQVVNLRLTVMAPREGALISEWLAAPHQPEAVEPDQERLVTFDAAGSAIPTRILWRPGLPAGTEVQGPAIIEEPHSTIVVFPGDVARVTEHGHILINVDLGEAGGGA